MTKRDPKKDIGEALAKLADQIIAEASLPDVVLAERVDAFKAVSVYHTALRKAKPDKDETDAPTFGTFRQKIEAVA